jgi:short-subunit dehydrogenase
VTQRAAVLAYAADIRAHFGTVHQAYANAGITYYGEVTHQSAKDIEQVLEVNFWGVVTTTTAFLPHLIASGDGHVITVSSLFGLIAFPGQSAYNASKFAVRGFTEALRQEMLRAGHPVAVTCVHPGGVKTAVARSAAAADGLDAARIAGIFDRRLALHSPERAAAAILAGVRRSRPRVVLGAEAKALDRLSRISPAAGQRAGVWMSRLLGMPIRSDPAP